MSVCNSGGIERARLAAPVEESLAANCAAVSSSCRADAPPMVLHVRVVTGQGGGPEKTILNSPRFLRQLGYESKLAYLHPPDDPGFDCIRQRGAALQAEVL